MTRSQPVATDPVLGPLLLLAPELAQVRCPSCDEPAALSVGPRGVAIACRIPGCKTRTLLAEGYFLRLAEHLKLKCDLCGATYQHELGIDGAHLRCPACDYSVSWNTVRTALLRAKRAKR